MDPNSNSGTVDGSGGYGVSNRIGNFMFGGRRARLLGNQKNAGHSNCIMHELSSSGASHYAKDNCDSIDSSACGIIRSSDWKISPKSIHKIKETNFLVFGQSKSSKNTGLKQRQSKKMSSSCFQILIIINSQKQAVCLT